MAILATSILKESGLNDETIHGVQILVDDSEIAIFTKDHKSAMEFFELITSAKVDNIEIF